ncbi:MAG TPA: hypothetical protein VF384_04045 [Planctomycetota bacterium]
MSSITPTVRRPAIALATGLLFVPLLRTQNQCPPPDRLATQNPFQATHYNNAPGQNNAAIPPIPQNLPPGYHGHGSYVNLTANADLVVSQIDYRLNDDGFLRFNWGIAPGVTGGPGMVGQTTELRVYMTPGTWQGTWAGPTPKIQVPPGPGSPWTLVGTGTLTVRPYNEHSPAVFATPFTVPAGTNGFAIVVTPITTPVPHITYATPPYALHPSLMVRAFAPGAPAEAHDQFLSITQQDFATQAFVSLPLPDPKGPVIEIHYAIANTAAYYTRKGIGCYDQPRSFYEFFEPGQFDLAHSTIVMTPNSDTYAVTSGNSAIVPPASPLLTNPSNVPLGDDARTGVKALGFTFPYPGGSTSSIVVTSNGNVFLSPAQSGSQTATASAFGEAGFLRGQPQLTAWWGDHNPAGGGGVHLDIDLTGAVPVAYVTWNNVPEWNQPGTSNTFQIAMFGDGRVEFRYGSCSPSLVQGLTGFSAGWSTHDPGNRDLSVELPFNTGGGALPPDLGMSARPIVGTTSNFSLRDLPADTTGIVVLGVPVHGFDLFFAGMPNCVQRVIPLEVMPFQAVGDTAAVPVSIPTGRWLIGRDLGAQAMVISPGSNPANQTISNSICLRVGD